MATLELHQVRKSYANGQPVIHGVDLDVEAGEFIVIVGPSGCGKSTLLRMVAGLETITDGEIRIAGARVNDMEPAERDVAMVFQNYALYPHMSVYDNMAYGLRIRKFTKPKIEERVQAAARILGLEKLLDRTPRALSGGQRQRVAMGRAIVREPRLFLFDEPLSNLDAKLRVQMRLELQTLHRRLRTTSLYVTHDQVEAMTLADRMVVMNGGIVEQVGTPQEVFDHPASVFVAGFIGSPPMNLIPVQINAQGQATTLAGVPVAIAPQAIPADLYGHQAVLGMRPEHLQIGAAGVTLVVDMVETLGSEQLVHGRIGDQACVVRRPTEGAAPLAPDAQVSVGVGSPTHLHWFSGETGRRIDRPVQY